MKKQSYKLHKAGPGRRQASGTKKERQFSVIFFYVVLTEPLDLKIDYLPSSYPDYYIILYRKHPKGDYHQSWHAATLASGGGRLTGAALTLTLTYTSYSVDPAIEILSQANVIGKGGVCMMRFQSG